MVKIYYENIKLVNKFVAIDKNISDVTKTISSIFLKCNYYICNDEVSIFDQFMNIIYQIDIEKQEFKHVANSFKEVIEKIEKI